LRVGFATAAFARGSDIDHFHCARKGHREIDVAARDVKIEPVGEKGHTDQHQKGERQHLGGWVRGNKGGDGPDAMYMILTAIKMAAIMMRMS